MTKESIQLTLTGGYLMQSLDHYLTPGRDGFFAEYGRRAFATNDAGEINPALHSSFFTDVTALAIEKGVPAEVVAKLREEAVRRVRQLLDTPGGLARLRATQIAWEQATTARRRAANN